MRHPAFRSLMLLVILPLLLSCTGAPMVPLEMTTLNPGDDHETIAHHYRHEAVRARQQADELANQAVVYEQLFGPESDWVSGARLLVKFYEEVAREQARLAEQHLKLGRGRSSEQPAPSRDH
ncbi:MAG: hypothetical protein JSS38_08785 [Nitrospira sp.]|nr:hypothetical protein [Nitrospira sp.]MBS0154674.1 hypothetical protein [Nitrospira sp.]MBS0166507.1 hypothetical protein [Nitrospira sp.]